MPPAITTLGDPFDSLDSLDSLVTKDYVDAQIESTPEFQEQHFFLKDTRGNPVGLFKGPVDINSTSHFTLYQPQHPECPTMPLSVTELHPMDYDTQVAFETLPVLEVWHYASGGILLKFPE